MTKKPTKKKYTTSLAIKQAQELSSMFAGSASLVKSDKPDEKQMILKVAEVFGVPAVCVNVMGGLPYINKDGLLFKLEDYESKQIVSLTSKAIQLATKKGEKAIFETTLVLKNGRSFNATGEADEDSIKLAAVKMTPNQMAETRSQNRCIRKAIQAKMLRELYSKLGGKNAPVDPEEKQIIEQAVTSSAEEMTAPPKQVERKEKVENLFGKAIGMIASCKDLIVLQDWENKIKTSKTYSEHQKIALLGAINGKIKEITSK